MRINKFLSYCGFGSRRAVEALIQNGEVTLNGKIVRNLATQVVDGRDVVTVEGRNAYTPRAPQFIMMNKPRGYVVSRDAQGGNYRRAHDLLPDDAHRSLEPVGRLDRDSTGLLLFTNKGDVAYRLTHPKFGCLKVYEGEVEGEVGPDALERLGTGVYLDDGLAQAESVELHHAERNGESWIQIVMSEGRKHIVRRMCEAVGHPVRTLNRIAMGPLELNNLRRGKTRFLSHIEIRKLHEVLGLPIPKEFASDAMISGTTSRPRRSLRHKK